LFEALGVDPLTNAYKDAFVPEEVQELQGRMAMLYTRAAELMTTGVLSDQDNERLKSINPSDPSMNAQQLKLRIRVLEDILGRNGVPTSRAEPADRAAPAAPQANTIKFGDLSP
jgi:hypothetical protein